MKCPNCKVNNTSSSLYCKQCGYKLHNNTATSGLDEIVFSPKEKNHLGRNILIGLLVCFVVFIFIRLSNNSSQNNNSTYTDYAYATPTPNLLAYLSINDYEMKWIGNQLYFSGILKNNSDKNVRDVQVRIDLYKDKDRQQLFDTRTVSIAGAQSYGAFSFQVPVYAYPTSTFWWIYKIIGGDFN